MHYPMLAPATRKLSATALLLTWPLLSALPSSWAAATDAAPDTASATGASVTPSQLPELGLNEGEIRLEGKLRIANPAQRTGLLAVTAFTLPNGKSSHLSRSKGKTIVFDTQTLVHMRGALNRRVALTALKNGVFAAVVGKDLGSGQSLTAREVAVWDRVANGVYTFSGATEVVDTGQNSAVAPPAPSTANVLQPPAAPPTFPFSPTTTTATGPINPARATGTGATSALTWQSGPILEVRIRTLLRPNNNAALRLPAGAALPPALANLARPSYVFTTVFKSPDAAPADASASLTMPAGLKRETSGPLNFTRPGASMFSGRARPLPVQLYWGSGPKIPDGQPNLTEAPRIIFGYYSHLVRPPESLTDIPTVAVGPVRTPPVAPGVDPPGATVADTPPPSAVGSYALTTSFAGNATFQVAADQDFLEPVHINLPAEKSDFAQPVTISWNPVAHAVGYRVLATGTRKKTDGPGQIGIMWTSSQVPPSDVTQSQPVEDTRQALKDGRLLPATATSCTVPAGVLAGLPAVNFMVEAFGPVRTIPGKPAIRISTSAEAGATLSDVNAANATDQATPPRPNPQPITPPVNQAPPVQ